MIRNTIQRTLILKNVRSRLDHPTADEVYRSVTEECPDISRATVYRVLNHLAEEGEILRVSVANAPDRFDLNLKPHAHSLCLCCGRVFDYPMEAFPDLPEVPDFTVKQIDLLVRGICSGCRG